MTTRTRHAAALGPAAALAAFVVLCAGAGAAGTVSPLPQSAYTVRAACGAPSPGRATCLALQLVPQTAQARARTRPLGAARAISGPTKSKAAEGDYGLTPEDLHAAYQLPTSVSSSQTIALVDAYNDLTAEADLATYDKELGLPECTAAGACFEKVNQSGETGNLPFPKSTKELETARKGSKAEREEAEEAKGWSVEISLDIETAHAICQSCHIALVEAKSSSFLDLEAAEDAAVGLGATEISNSWAGPECSEGFCAEDSAAFNHPGVVITAAAGDRGYLNWLEEPRSLSANFPASSPHVVAVGGTRLALDSKHEWTGETVWNDGGESEGRKDGYGAGGSGCSERFPAASWQLAVADWSAVGCEKHRAIADTAADADPYTGVAVYGVGGENWGTVGGTSLASPVIAAAFALAGGAHGVEYPARTLYENALAAPASLHDVTSGSTGECPSPFDYETGLPACTPTEEAKTSCSSDAICLARTGYDGPTGVGTPDGIAAFVPSGPPTVVTGAASSLTQTSTTLNATVNPNGEAVSECELEYGPTASYGTNAPCTPSPGSGSSPVAVSAAITSLAANTTYHFRIAATNSAGTSKGSDQAFKTLPDPPTATTGTASSLSPTSATLNAEVNPNGAKVSECKLEYGPTASYGTNAACNPSPGSGSSPVAVSAAITSLTANTTYHFRIAATNAGGTSHGSDQTFKTLATSPTVVTGAASSITQTSATLNGTVNANGEAVSECELEFGPTASYGTNAPCTPPPGSGSSPVAVSAAITSLTANTTYHFRIVATNSAGTSKGSDQTFKTLPDPPTATTGTASSLSPTSATLNAEVNPNGAKVSECKLEYGPTASYGTNAACNPSPGSGSSPVAVTAALTSLDANTTYHFRIAATNAGGTSHGSDQTFKTLATSPTVVTGAASAVTQTSATLSAVVNPNGEEVNACTLEYGTTVSYGTNAPCTPSPGSGNSPVTVSAPITGLASSTGYHFRVVATSTSGASYGADQTFTTQLPTILQPLVPGEQGVSPSPGESPAQERSTPPVPDAELVSRALTASSSGTISVEVSCPAGESSCSGKLTLLTLGSVSLGTAAHQSRKPKAAILTLAVGSFNVAGGRVTTVKLHLSAKARALLARNHVPPSGQARTLFARTHVLRARASLFARDPAGATHTALCTITIRAAKAARARKA